MKRVETNGALWNAPAYASLCSRHFKPCMFDKTGQTTRLRDDATPSEFDFPAHLKKQEHARRTLVRHLDEGSSEIQLQEAVVEERVCRSATSVAVDHAYPLPDAKVLKHKLDLAEETRKNLAKKLKNTCGREVRAKATCRTISDELTKLALITDELKMKLDSYADFPIELFAKPVSEYTNDQREFALTLHLYGPKAYEYLRKKLDSRLPHPRTLRKWLESVDDKPGLNKSVFDSS